MGRVVIAGVNYDFPDAFPPHLDTAIPWDGSTIDMSDHPTATIIAVTSPTTAYNVQWSALGQNWYNISGITFNFDTVANIATSFTGPITYQGYGFLRLNGGVAGTFQIVGNA